MPRRINKVTLYICNGCQAVFNEGREAKDHWRAHHGNGHAAGRAVARRRARPRRA